MPKFRLRQDEESHTDGDEFLKLNRRAELIITKHQSTDSHKDKYSLIYLAYVIKLVRFNGYYAYHQI